MKQDRQVIRRTGAMGALMDEYERACTTLTQTLQGLPESDFTKIFDVNTEDKNCRSIKTIMNHVLVSGYAYADYIRAAFGLRRGPHIKTLQRVSDVQGAMSRMLRYTSQSLEGKWELTDDEIVATRIHTRWGVTYDLEQLFEHAIVHVLRHRRQIDHFLSL